MTDTQFAVYILAAMCTATVAIGVGMAAAEFIVRAVDRATANRRARVLRKNPFA